VVTFTLMGLCTLVYLVTLSCEAFGDDENVRAWVYQYLWLTPAEGHWWAFLTSQFVHGGFFHLAGNMIYLFLFGACVEDIIGRTRFTIFYLLSGVAAAFSHILVSPEHFASDIPMGGASGAISGCIGGFLLLLAKHKIEFRWFIFFFFRFWSGVFRLPAWLVISFWFSEDVLDMVLTRLAEHDGGGVAFAAHVGGTLAGMGLIAIEKIRLKRTGGLDELEEEEVQPVARPLARARMAPQPTVVAIETPTIYLSWNGAHYGPYALSQIQPMFKRGEIPDAASYWQQGMDAWRAADELRDPSGG
jgi:membrane associated rhomboid family serine protease